MYAADPEGFVSHADRTLDEIIRVEGAQVVATLCRLTGDLDRAEEALADAAVVALERWPLDGVPDRPGAWLTTVARRKALDVLRREGRRSDKELEAEVHSVRHAPPIPPNVGSADLRDDQLRLIFTCCHPALAPEARVALALRTLCGLTTAEIAKAFLVPEPTMGQRISRAKKKISRAGIPYQIPGRAELPGRLSAVLSVVNLVFTTGHHAPSGAELVRVDLANEAVRLARLLVALLPDEPEAIGLLALLESTHARRSTRIDPSGDVVLLTQADRSRWDRPAIEAAESLIEQALRMGRPGPFQVQAAISCLHSSAPDPDDTDWRQIAVLYLALEQFQPTPVVRVNRAVAVAEVDGPEAGLALLDTVEGAERWHLFHTTRAELLRRAGRTDEAAAAYRAALALEPNEVDSRYLERRLTEIGWPGRLAPNGH